MSVLLHKTALVNFLMATTVAQRKKKKCKILHSIWDADLNKHANACTLHIESRKHEIIHFYIRTGRLLTCNCARKLLHQRMNFLCLFASFEKKKLLKYSWSWMSLISSFQQKFWEFMLGSIDTQYTYVILCLISLYLWRND